MLAKIKSAANKSKVFCQEHPTIVACAATAVVTAKFTHDRTLHEALRGAAHGGAELAQQFNQEMESAKNAMMYTFDFLDSKGLMEEYTARIESL